MKGLLAAPVESARADQPAAAGPPARASLRRHRLAVVAGTVALAAVGGAAYLQLAQPREQVVVAARDLPAGHRIAAADLSVTAVAVGPGRGSHLLVAGMIGLVPGELLSRPVVAGAPILDTEIHPPASHVPILPEPVGMHCALPGPG